MRVLVWGSGLVVSLVLGLSACGDDGGSGVASAGGAAATASASPRGSLSAEDAQLKFAQCMRENGVDVPDPGGDEPMRLGEGGGRRKLEAALDKCREWLQAGGRMPDLKDPEVRDQFVEFAQCMRENGVDIPDPGPDGQIRLPTGKADRSKVEKAREACGKLLPGAGR